MLSTLNTQNNQKQFTQLFVYESFYITTEQVGAPIAR